MIGQVKWFCAQKGWGFIAGQDGNEYFAHYSQIAGDGYRNLTEDREVEFDIEKDLRGRVRAINIKQMEVTNETI